MEMDINCALQAVLRDKEDPALERPEKGEEANTSFIWVNLITKLGHEAWHCFSAVEAEKQAPQATEHFL